MKIETECYYLRNIELDDVNEKYLGWLKDETTSRYIETAKQNDNLDDLKNTVKKWIDNPEVLFLGIFDKNTNEHIGNIKFTPLNIAENYAILGVLIGENKYRGKGVAKEIINACGQWLKEHKGISRMILGVDINNTAAIKAYEKTGFKIKKQTREFEKTDKLIMVYDT